MKGETGAQEHTPWARWYARIHCGTPGKHRGFGFLSSWLTPAATPGEDGIAGDRYPTPPGLPCARAGLPGLLAAACLAGCGGEAPPPPVEGGPILREAPVKAQPQVAEAEVPEGAQDRWLSWKDTRNPVTWLESFDDSPEAGSPERRTALFELIGQLDERYLEDPRMLANRTVQLRNMLDGIGVREDMHVLLRGFADLTRGVEGREDQFGEKVAFYVRLREAGASHEQALAQIETGRPALDPEAARADTPDSADRNGALSGMPRPGALHDARSTRQAAVGGAAIGRGASDAPTRLGVASVGRRD